jgi:hypothetical protein
MAHANENPTGTKGHHEFVPPSAAKDPQAQTGYIEKDYEHKEYPKHVGTNEEGQPIVVNSEKEEKAYLAKKAAKAAKPAASE